MEAHQGRQRTVWQRISQEAPALVERSMHVGAEVASEKLVEVATEPHMGWELLRYGVPLVGLLLVVQLMRHDLGRAKSNPIFALAALFDMIDLCVHCIVLYALVTSSDGHKWHQAETLGLTAAIGGIGVVFLGSVTTDDSAHPHHRHRKHHDK